MTRTADEVLRRMRAVLYTAPTTEPLTLDFVKQHVRRDDTVDDVYLAALIKSARQRAERDTRRAFLTQTWDVYADAFPSGRELLLPKPKLQSVTSITAYDDADVATTLATTEYYVDTASEPGRVVLRTDATWPTVERCANGVIIRIVCGYGTANDVPEDLKTAMRLLIAANYEHREQMIVAQFAGQFLVVPDGYDQTVARYRVWRA